MSFYVCSRATNPTLGTEVNGQPIGFGSLVNISFAMSQNMKCDIEIVELRYCRVNVHRYATFTFVLMGGYRPQSDDGNGHKRYSLLDTLHKALMLLECSSDGMMEFNSSLMSEQGLDSLLDFFTFQLARVAAELCKIYESDLSCLPVWRLEVSIPVSLSVVPGREQEKLLSVKYSACCLLAVRGSRQRLCILRVEAQSLISLESCSSLWSCQNYQGCLE